MADPATLGAGLGTAAIASKAIPGPIDDVALALVGGALVANEVRKGVQSGAYDSLTEAFAGVTKDVKGGVLKTLQFGRGNVQEGPTELTQEERGTGVLQEPKPEGSLTDILEQLIPTEQKGISTELPGVELIPMDRFESPSELVKTDPVMTMAEVKGNPEGSGAEKYPIRDSFDEPVDKFIYNLRTKEYSTVSQSHFWTAEKGTKSSELIRGFVNEKQGSFGSRPLTPDDPYWDINPTEEDKAEILANSFDKSWNFAEDFFKHHPEMKFYVPNLDNTVVGVTERLDINKFKPDEILTRETVLGKGK